MSSGHCLDSKVERKNDAIYKQQSLLVLYSVHLASGRDQHCTPNGDQKQMSNHFIHQRQSCSCYLCEGVQQLVVMMRNIYLYQ